MPVGEIGNGNLYSTRIGEEAQVRPKNSRSQSSEVDKGESRADSESFANDRTNLSADEQKEVQKLKQADRQVRAHEMAHMAAGGRYIRKAASYTYRTGPDGKRYAVGGEVSIDVSSESTPEATIQKMKTVQSAAMAPAQPSSQDYAVAGNAAQKAAAARMEKAKETREEAQESAGGAGRETEVTDRALENEFRGTRESSGQNEAPPAAFEAGSEYHGGAASARTYHQVSGSITPISNITGKMINITG